MIRPCRPLAAVYIYINEGYQKFQEMANFIALEVSMYVLNMQIAKVEESKV